MRAIFPKPLIYQQEIIEWLDDPEVKCVAFLKSRQSGGSFLNRLLCCRWALENRNVKISYITPTLKLGKLFYTELVKTLKPWLKRENASDLILKTITGSTIQFFSAESKDSIRGFNASYTIIDEAAFMTDDLWNLIIQPSTLVIGKKIVMCSTPNGSQGFFYQHVQFGIEKRDGYRTRKVTVYDNPFVSPSDIAEIKSQIPDRVFRQEYLAEFMSGAGSVFTNFKNCIVSNPVRSAKVYAAIDWGRSDYTVLTIMNDKAQVIYRYRVHQLDYTTIAQLIAAKLNEWKPAATISENNGIGAVINDMLVKQYTGRLKRVTLDHALKKKIIEDLIVAFEQGKIGIDDDPILLSELQAFTCTYSKDTLSLKYGAPSGLHDDCCISLAYVFFLAKTDSPPMYSLSIV